MKDEPIAHEWLDQDVAHIDVRGLPAPQPLVAILRRVHTPEQGQTLVVHHDRDPVRLYAERAEIGGSAERIPAPAGEVRLLLRELP